MADDRNYIGIAFGADVSDLKEGLALAEKQISNATNSFKKSTVGMKDWQKSIEGVEAKTKQLSDILVSQNQKLAGLKAEYKKVAEEQGASSEAALKLQQAVKRQQAVVNATQREFLNYSQTLDDAKKGVIDLEKVSIKGGKAIKDVGKKAKDSGDDVEDLGDAAKGLSDGFTVAKGAIAGFISNGLTALVNMGKNAISTVLGLADATREYRSTLATLDTAAKDAGVNTDKMREKFTDLMGVFNDEDSITEGLNNLMAAGFDEKNIDAITQQLEGAALKFKDTLKFEGLSDGLQETLAQGKAIGPFAELLERSGVNLETFDAGLAKATTSADKQKYVLQQLSKLGLGEVSKAYREQNADMIDAQKANVDYQNSVAAMGERIEPITTRIREGFTKILDKILELTANVDFEALGEQVSGAFDSFVNEVMPKIVEGLQWLKDNFVEVTAGIVGIGAAFAAWKVVSIVQGIIKAFNAWKVATEGLTIAQRVLNLVMKANPVGLVISLIMGLVAAFVVLWNKSDAFRNFWIGLWDKIKSVASDAWQGLTNGAKKAWDGIKSVFSKVGSFFGDTFSKAWQKVKDIFSTGGKIFDGIKDGITSAFKNIVNAIIRGINKVVAVPFNAINTVLDKIRTVEIAGFSPFSGLISKIAVPEIPELFRGGVLKKGQVGLLEGKGDEAVVPLEKNTGWIKRIASELSKDLNVQGIKNSLAVGTAGAGAYAGANTGGRVVNIDARQTLNYNGKMSLKETKKAEREHLTTVKLKLRAEGAI